MNLKLSQIFSFLTWLEHSVFERETISNYEEDQEKQFENDQESTEDTIGNDIISFLVQKSWTFFTSLQK